jgi:tetratricopeptide (TPR) repeat protein
MLFATLQVGEFCEANGYLGAAEEYSHCALALARSVQRDRLSAAATRALARVALAAGRIEEAEQISMQACDLALAADDRAEWVRAVGQLAAVHRRRGAVTQARDALLQTLRRARDWTDDAVTGIALAQLAQHAVTQEQFDTAVEHGWSAVRLLDAGVERTRVLLLLGEALVRLGLVRAAIRCYTLAAQGAHTAALRVAAQSGLASAAAELPDREQVAAARNAAQRELSQTPRLPRAAAHIELGRAAFQCGDIDDAREHLRHALALLGPAAPRELGARAEDLLRALERNAAEVLSRPLATEVLEQTRRIAAQLEQAAADSLATAP